MYTYMQRLVIILLQRSIAWKRYSSELFYAVFARVERLRQDLLVEMVHVQSEDFSEARVMPTMSFETALLRLYCLSYLLRIIDQFI